VELWQIRLSGQREISSDHGANLAIFESQDAVSGGKSEAEGLPSTRWVDPA
jgi:hypothetical protein